MVVAYGLILPKPILDAPRLGCVNVHASLLPRWRGAAPINRAIMEGDTESGVTIMKMDEGLDTGADGAGGAHRDRCRHDRGRFARRLGTPRRGSDAACAGPPSSVVRSRSTPQPAEGVTYAAKISKNETRIDWAKPGKEVHNHIRGLSPFPGAWFEIGGVRIKALRSTGGEGKGTPGAALDDHMTIACGDGAIRLTQVQRDGQQADERG